MKKLKTILHNDTILGIMIVVSVMAIILIPLSITGVMHHLMITGDTPSQYVSFIIWYKNLFNGQSNLYWTWNILGGYNAIPELMYYLASPFNLLFLLIPKSLVGYGIGIITALKLGVAGWTFYYFLRKTQPNLPKYIIFVFSLFYGLSSELVEFWDAAFIWSDGLILLPLVLYGLHKLIFDKKPALFTVALSLSIFTNFYIGFYITVFALLYALYLMISTDTLNIKTILFGIANALIAVGLTAIGFLPTLFHFSAFSSAENLNNGLEKQLVTLPSVFGKLLLNSYDGSIVAFQSPYIYCGLLTLILAVFAFIKFNKRERIGAGIVIGVYLLCFFIPAFDWVMNLGHSVNGFAFRYSFLFSTFLIILGAKGYGYYYDDTVVNDLSIYNNKSLKTLSRFTLIFMITVTISLALVLFGAIHWSSTTTIAMVLNIPFLFVYWFVLFKMFNPNTKRFWLVTLCIAEVTISTLCLSFVYYADRGGNEPSKLSSKLPIVEKVTSVMSDDDRLIDLGMDLNDFISNYPVQTNVNSITGFSSISQGDFRNGLQDTFNSFNGGTNFTPVGINPLWLAMYGTQYIGSSQTDFDMPLTSLASDTDHMYLYKINTDTSMAYGNYPALDDKSLLSDPKLTVVSTNAKSYKVKDNRYIYTELHDGQTDVEIKVKVTSKKDTITTLRAITGSHKATVARSFSEYIDNQRTKYALPKFTLEHNNTVIKSKDNKYADYMMYFTTDSNAETLTIKYHIDKDSTNPDIDLAGKSYNVDAVKSAITDADGLKTTIGDASATIENNGSNDIMTSIPYDKGWSVNSGVQIINSNGKIQLKNTKNVKNIELKFKPRGLITGVVITVVSIILLVIECQYIKSKKVKE